MKFSICIPNYNYGDYIGETIESVLSQTYQNFEICIADNHSTDNSWEVIQNYVKKDSRIKATRNAFNLGFSGNLDKVASLATGDWHIMLSSDDLMLPTALEEYNNIIEKNNHDTDIMINSSVLQFDNDDQTNVKFIGNRRNIWGLNFTKQDGVIIERDTSFLLKNGMENFVSPFNFVSLCYSKASYYKSGGYGSSRIQNPDKWFHWKICLYTEKCFYINKVLFKYRWHNSNQLSIQKKTGVLRYWLDEYRNCFEISELHLKKAGISKQVIEKIFIKKCIENYMGLAVLNLRVIEAIRLWGFGLFTYPNLFVKTIGFWIMSLVLSIPLALIGIIFYMI